MTSTMDALADYGLQDLTLVRDRCYVGGSWVDSGDGGRLTVTDPASGQVVGSVPTLTRDEVRKAVSAARRAFEPWRDTTARDRARVLRRWHDLILDNAEDLARLMTAEQGKPLREARGEVAYSAAFVEWYAEEAPRVYGDTMPGHQPDKRILVLKQPVGVTAAITPWNFPLAMITRKCAPALAVGCTTVIKPAPQTPLSALALAALAERAGLPPGVLNVVTGDSEVVGPELTSNPDIRKLSFTGSTRVGKLLMAQCASTVKKVSLELGGNAPFVVLADADLDAAVEGAVASKFRNSGQTCVCANRILVDRRVHDDFVERLTTRVRKLTVGPGIAEDTEQGPLIDVAALERVESLMNQTTADGARLVTGGRRHELGGTFFEPTVVTDVRPEMRLVNGEIFGPIAPVIPFRDDAEAVRMANDTPYGLAAYLYGRDISRVWRVSEQLDVGVVGVNTGIISSEVAPFGGVKESGIGREGSKYGTEEYVETKYVCLQV